MNISGADVTELSTDEGGTTLIDMDLGGMVDEPMEENIPYVPLSKDVLRSLTITEEKGTRSLYDLLNKCSINQGKRLLQQWISRPLLDVTAIEKRLDLVEYFVQNPSVRKKVSDVHLKKFPDFTPVIKKLERKRVSLQDLYRTYVAILRIPALISEIGSANGAIVSDSTAALIEERFIKPFTKSFEDFAQYQELIRETIDIEYYQSNGEYRIKPTTVPVLLELDKSLEAVREEMREDWKKICHKTKLNEKVLKFEFDHRLGYLYRVTRKDEKMLRNSGVQLIHVDTKNSGYRFRTTRLEELNGEYLGVTARYEKAQGKVFDELLITAASYSGPLKTLDCVLAPLDVIVSLAQTAFEARTPFVRPKILPQEFGVIELIDSRHLVIEHFMGRDFIPNSVRFEQGKSTFHIVTGPNMGGKSTYIRQVALNVIMAQIGSFVPCRAATVSLIDGLYTRIGAGDSVTKGVSTFMMEMLEVQEILKSASKYSLIIIDELGRGTSTYDGYGLAYAISESIANELGSYCMLTTHFNELADLKTTAKNVVLSHVAALVRQEGITFQYAVEPGVCSQSFGVNVAQMAGLPAHVLEDAKEILCELENAHKTGIAATMLATSPFFGSV